MTNKKLELAMDEIKTHRSEIINKLLEFSSSDALLFWGKDESLVEKQEALWGPILNWAGSEFHTKYKTTDTLSVPEQDDYTGASFKDFMSELSDKELAAFYLAAINTKSELVAAALVKGEINAEQAFNASCLEEIWQADHWGKEDSAENVRDELKAELCDIETFLKR